MHAHWDVPKWSKKRRMEQERKRKSQRWRIKYENYDINWIYFRFVWCEHTYLDWGYASAQGKASRLTNGRKDLYARVWYFKIHVNSHSHWASRVICMHAQTLTHFENHFAHFHVIWLLSYLVSASTINTFWPHGARHFLRFHFSSRKDKKPTD